MTHLSSSTLPACHLIGGEPAEDHRHWICCVCPPAGFQPGPVAIAMVEPKIDALRAATANASDVRSHVEAILRGGFVPDDLVQHTPFVDRVVQFPELILTGGVRAAAAEALAAGKSAA